MMEANASGIRNWNTVSNHSYEIEREEKQGGGIEGEDKQKASQTEVVDWWMIKEVKYVEYGGGDI